MLIISTICLLLPKAAEHSRHAHSRNEGLEVIDQSHLKVSPGHTLIAVVGFMGRFCKVLESGLQLRNARLEEVNLVLLIFDGAINVGQGHDDLAGLLQLELDLGGGSRDLLDVKRAIDGRLTGSGSCAWGLGGGAEEPVEDAV